MIIESGKARFSLYGFFKKHKVSIFIFLLALSVRVLLFFVNLGAQQGGFETTIHGSDWYFEVAKNLSRGLGFSIFGHTPSPIHVPIYPLFLSASLVLFGNFIFAVVTQMVIGSFIPVLGIALSRRLISHKKVTLFVGIVLALEPNFVLLSSIFFTETLFIFLFLLFILVFISYLEKGSSRLLVQSALLLGISALTKTTVQFFPLFLLPLAWWTLRKTASPKKLVMHGFLFVLIFLSTLSPWLYRNYKVFGVPGMTIMPSFNLYFTFVPSVLSLHNNTDFISAREAFMNSTVVDPNTLTFATASRFNKEALSVISKYPKEVMEVVGINVLTFFTHDGMLTVLQNSGITPTVPLSKPAIILLVSSPAEFMKTVLTYVQTPFILVLLMRLLWIAVTVSFFIGCVKLLRERKMTAPLGLALIIVFYFTITTPSNGLTANARFRMPVVPIILTVAAYTFIRENNKNNPPANL